jgi:glyoxylase-like metal-dependent hydrolase (beta-lactamase superfamily II)
MKIGAIDVDLLCDGTFRLDGGAMFGVVPKPLWEKKSVPDASNRILLGLHPLLVRTNGRVIVVDTGIGRKETGRFPEIFAVGGETDVVSSLAQHGLGANDVDTVVCTHLHFDHAGGGTRKDEDGRIVPTFPRARHLVQRTELTDAEQPSARSRASYFPDNWAPIRDAGLLDVVEGEIEVAPGVRTLLMKGHIRALQGVVVESEGTRAVYLADTIPTAAHVPAPWVMGYDLYPLDTLAFKERILARIVDEGWILFFEHDPVVGAARLHREGREIAVEELLPAPVHALR